MLQIAAKALSDKKGGNIEAIKVSDVATLADYFPIWTGSSSTQVKALAEEVELKLSQAGMEPRHIEGKSTTWILLDYGELVVHVFYKEARDFYQLERLWVDGVKVDLTEIIEE